MATTYNTAFGSLPGYNELLGTTNTTGGGQQQVYGQRAQQQRTTPTTPSPFQTFAQLQRQGMARPAPPTTPTAQPFAQYGGSQQAQQMRQRLQQQLETYGQAPSRFDTQAFQQIRGAQAANLQQEYQAQQQQLNEELARRGLFASSIGGGRMGDLAGQQARALATLDAQLLQQAAETQAQDRAQLLSAGQGLAELAASQDLAQFDANRVAQAATFENQLRAAQFGQEQFQQYGQEAFQAAQAEEAAQQAARQFDLAATGQAAGLSLDLQRLLGQQELERAQLTGQLGGAQTLAGQQLAEQRRQFDIQQTLQQQLGLGGLDVQRGQLTLEQQRLAQQGEQFLAQLDEQQAARLQQGGFTTTELAIKRSQVDNELALQNRQISETERNNLAIRNLERDRFNEQKDIERAQLTGQLGTGTTAQQTLGAQQQQFQQRQVLFQQAQQMSQQSGVQYTVDEKNLVVPLRDAQGNVVRTSDFTQAEEARKLQSEELTLRRQLGLMEATGQGLTVDAEGRIVAGTGATAQTLQARQLAFQNAARLSEQSGVQYTVDERGNVVPLRDAQGDPVRTSAETRAAEAIKLQQAGITGTFGEGADQRLTQDALQTAYARAAQLTQETGIRHTVNPTTGEITAATGTGRESLEAQLRQAGITGTFGGALTQQALQDAYTRAAQLSQITGQQYDVDPTTGAITLKTGTGGAAVDTLAAQLQRATLTGQLGGQDTLERLQQNLQNAQVLSQITGKQYTVDKDGNFVEAGAATAQTEAARQFDLEQALRRQLGLTEASGFVYEIISGLPTRTTQETVQGQLARSQLLMSLAQTLSGLAPDQIAQILGQRTVTTTGTVTTSSGGGSGTPVDGSAAGQPPTGGTTYTVGQNYTDKYGYTWTKTSTGWSLKSTPATGGTTTSTTASDVNKPPTNPTEGQLWTDSAGRTYRWTNGQWVLQTTTTTASGTTTTASGTTTTTRAATTTTASGTTTTVAPTTTTVAPTTTTVAPTTTTASTNLTPVPTYWNIASNPIYFNGQYQNTQYGWAISQNGQWYVATSSPTYTQVTTPSGQFNVSAYPGYSIYDGGKLWSWNGTQWVDVNAAKF